MTELSCSCGLDVDDSERWYITEGWTTSRVRGAKRRRRCSSCKELIGIDAECLMFSRWRRPNEIEENIFSEDAEISTAPSWYCEKCGEIFEGLDDAGFCFDIKKDNMVDAMKAYHKLTGFKPLEKFGRKEN